MIIISSEEYVWADIQGSSKGQNIEPLYYTVPNVCKQDKKLYELLALTDVFRVGKVREIELAHRLIRDRLYAYSSKVL